MKNDLRLLLTVVSEGYHPQSTRLHPGHSQPPNGASLQGLGYCNIMVDSTSCHLVGVVHWAEAEVGPFRSNLYSLQTLTGKFHLKKGWIRYEDYDSLQKSFWDTIRTEAGLSQEQTQAAKSAAIVGMLRSRGFTRRLANTTLTRCQSRTTRWGRPICFNWMGCWLVPP